MKLLEQCSYCQQREWPGDENHLHNMLTFALQLTSMATVLHGITHRGPLAGGSSMLTVDQSHLLWRELPCLTEDSSSHIFCAAILLARQRVIYVHSNIRGRSVAKPINRIVI